MTQKSLLFLVFAFLLAACPRPQSTEQNSESSGNEGTALTTNSSNSAADAGDAAPQSVLVPEFASRDAEHWVNGQPTMLADLRGNVVLIESWHRL